MPGFAFNIKKETLTQVFSCEFSCEHHFYRTSLVAASALKLFKNIDVLSADLEILINTKNLVLKNSSIFFLWLIKLEAVVRRCSVKRVFLEFLHRCFPMNFVKFLRTPVFIEHVWWLLLKVGFC